MQEHLALNELHAGLEDILQSPTDGGPLRAIVIRPKTGQRKSLDACQLSPGQGVHGDNWATGCWMSLPDGRPHPDVQVSIMNARTIALIAREQERWPLAGDNLYVDLDLSESNLVCGQRLSLGTAILEITAEPHQGCHKFAQRFGQDALKFVNSKQGTRLHLRGIYAKVIQPGLIRLGDILRKLPASGEPG